jgi:CzcA family heavy metal efflux pump
MLNRIVHFSLRFRGVVVVLACLLTGYGIYVSAHAKLDVFPNFVPPQVTVETEAHGLSPEQVEALVTRPLESTINGLGNMAALRSESISGLSVINAVFKDGTDIFIARQMLNEKLSQMAGELPAGVQSPKMSPLMSSTMDLLKIGLTSDKLSPMELRTLADWTIKPRLLAVPGVAHCIVFGGEVRQLQIQVLPDRLMAYRLSISDVLAAARASTAVMGGGFVENANQRILIQTEGQALTPEVLGEVAVAHQNGQTVRLKDVAKVMEGAEPKFGDSLIQGRPGVFMAMASQYGANTMEATLAVEKALDELKPLLEKEQVKLWPRLHRPATFIENSLHNIEHSLYVGGVLVAIVLFLFLGHFRTAFISITAIPLSLLTAIVLMDKFGITLNTITLGGLAIAIGAVVDDAIIDVENIFRRLRENRALPQPRPVFGVVLDASLEVRSAVVYATFIVALVFLPVLTMTGLQGSFFAPLALSYILAIMASLGVALTVTPALCLLFLGEARGTQETRLQRGLKAGYERVLKFFALWPRAVMLAVVIICICAFVKLPGMFGNMELMPDFREGHFVIQVTAVPGTSLPAMLQIGANLTKQLLEKPEVATVEQQVGRAEQGEDTWEPNRCEFHVELKENVPGKQQAKLMDDIHDMLDGYPGIQGEVVTFLGDRISESISGEAAPVVISVYGDDLDVIDDKADEIVQVLNNTNLVQGASGVKIESPPGAPRMAVRLRPERLTQFGFRPVDVLEGIEAAYQGAIVAQVHDRNRVTEVAVMLEESNRREPEQVGSLMLKNSEGLSLPLRELADVYMTSGRFTILHDNASRRQVVTCSPQGRDVTSFVADAKKQILANVKFPSGVYVVFTGEAEQAAAAQTELLVNSAIAAVGILLLLIIVTGNWRNLLLILANVPFALVGGVVAVLIAVKLGQGGLTIGSLVGFVTLFGITTRNSIMMISHFEHLVGQEGMEWGVAAAMRGASERLIPILMTALVTAIGLLPLAIGTGEAGREIEGPMAIVILGGLITSTALNLLVLPTLALRYGKFVKAARSEE